MGLFLPLFLRSNRLRELLDNEDRLTKTIRIGYGTYGHEMLKVHQWNWDNNLSIGNFCSISDGVHVFLGGNHDTKLVSTFPFTKKSNRSHWVTNTLSKSNGDVTIGSDVWIGSGATIMSGVKIGHGAVIAANSHVVRNVAPYEIVGGNPALHIKFRFESNIRSSLIGLAWWDWDFQFLEENLHFLMEPPTVASIQLMQKKYNKYFSTLT